MPGNLETAVEALRGAEEALNAAIGQAYREGASVRDVAKATGKSVNTILRINKDRGVPSRNRAGTAMNGKMRRLQVLTLHDSGKGLRVQEIAVRLGVSTSYVYALLKNKDNE
jgi:transposase